MSHSDQDRRTLGVSQSSSVPEQLENTRATRNPVARTSPQARTAGVQVYDPFPSEPHDDEENVASAAGEES